MICCPSVSNNAQELTNIFSQFVTLSTYPVTSPCTAIPGNLFWCYSRPSRVRLGWNSLQRAQQSIRGKLSTLIWISSVLICPGPLPSLEGVCVAQSRYGLSYEMDDRGMIVRLLVAEIFCTLIHNLQIWSKDDLTFYSTGSRGSFVWVEGIQGVTPVIVVYVAGCKWKYRSIWYT